MPPPLAYFLTWTCYGTRLHGDDRGTVDRDNNRRGAPYLPSNPAREISNRRRMLHSPFSLATSAREIVQQTIRTHCDFRGWTLLASNVRTTHVHVVVKAPGVAPEAAMIQLKSWCTRRLREGGHVAVGAQAWTEHGSTRWINHENGLVAAIDYVSRLQDEPGRFEREERLEVLLERLRRRGGD